MKRLEEELKKYGQSDYYAFHMPGHKRKMSDAAIAHPFSMDITEIDGFDNLHHAEGILKDAQEEAAEFYGVEESFFSVNGSTAALLSAVSAATTRDGKILMARNCHKAVYHAVYLRGLEAVYLYPKWEKQENVYVKEAVINGRILPGDVDEALAADPQIQAVLITSPTYDGIVSDVAAIAEISHKYGVPLIVDEAHGAHFCMHDYFPASAVELGADVVIQSLHKTLPALTQTAILHRCTNQISSEGLHKFMGIYQTSSPSYIFMSSITSCLHVLKERGMELYEDYVNLLDRYRQKLKRLKNIHLVEVEGMDRSKIVLVPDKLFMTGSALYTILLDKYHLQMEMEAPGYVLALSSVGDTEDGFARLYEALNEIDLDTDLWTWESKQDKRKVTDELISEKNMETCEKNQLFSQNKTACMRISQAMEAGSRACVLTESAGRISTEFVYLYPPGIPLLVPGEEIVQELLDKFVEYEAQGLNLQGLSDYTNTNIRVVESMGGRE